MAWIESHQKLERDPKLFDFMELMCVDINSAIGLLHRFWWWCVDHAHDGDLQKFNDKNIGRAIGLNSGDCKKFVESMVAAGFIERQPYFRIANWWKFTGKYLKIKYRDDPETWKNIQNLYTVGNTVSNTKDITDRHNRQTKHKYGEYRHVCLTDEEHEKLKQKLNSRLDYWIKQLDEGIQSKGYKYKDHYLTILKWVERERPGEVKRSWEE